LWQDIVALQDPDGEPGHYMGFLVLQSGDERNFNIIDGQQRMTTLNLLVLAVLKNLRRLSEEDGLTRRTTAVVARSWKDVYRLP
jgi:uncharacterized protein with ParB-like and HNH nuclease domain